MHLAASNEPDLSDPSLRSALRRNDLPLGPKQPLPPQVRLLTSWMFYAVLALLAVEALCLVWMWAQLVPDREVRGGIATGLGTETIEKTYPYALATAIPLTLIFIWADRFRPQRFWVWLLTIGWGGCVATYVSLQVNSWAATHLSIVGNGDPATAARAATFVAPFVEESSKASILFLLAIAMRYRWVSKLSGIVLAGLSATAFAFSENIIYYTRAYRAAARYGIDPERILHNIVIQRGVLTFFGHPLFTSMTGIGLAIALRSKSRVVRILAPVTGFLAAAFLHMLFNGVASSGQPGVALLVPLMLVAYPLVITVTVFTVRQVLAQRRVMTDRLGDYVRLGWLPESDLRAVSGLWTRIKILWQGLWAGHLWSTWMLQRALTELAYLRDSMARGLIDEAGLVREKQLLFRARTLRLKAVSTPMRETSYPWNRWWARRQRRRNQGAAQLSQSWAPPGAQQPQGPASIGVPITSAVQYSAVDPRWRPPS